MRGALTKMNFQDP